MHPDSEMEKGEDLKSWEEFIERTHDLQKITFANGQKIKAEGFLYRGHGDSSWGMDTTLERWGASNYLIESYFRDVLVAKPQMETYLGEEWEMPDHEICEKWLKDWDGFFARKFPGYGFLVYMRHHGFPSPLLDWSRSPFVAAFFAFQKCLINSGKSVSVIAFNEFPIGFKGGAGGEARINVLGPYIRSHKRHYQQQSEYTICTNKNEHDQFIFVHHEKAFERGHPSQDLKWKFNIPMSEKVKALKYLDKHNINAYSLYGSEDSLCETMAVRRYLFK